MSDKRETILGFLNEEKDVILELFTDLLRARSPNPPGDTRQAAKVVQRFLEARDLSCKIVSPHPEMPNIISRFESATPGRHLVLNGHIDVFPVTADLEGWSVDPWGAEKKDGKIYGRGASDMKAGTTASIVTFWLLSRLREHIRGKLTLTCVSDEETFGPWGARYLMEHHPEVHGDCLLNGEPSGPEAIIFAERGPCWIQFDVRTPGAHGAMVHLSKSASKIAMELARDLEQLTELEAPLSGNIQRSVDLGRMAMDQTWGQGAGDLVSKVTLNIGVISGGEKVNMIPSHCMFVADLRLPLGMKTADLLDKVADIARRHPEATWQYLGGDEPAWSDPDHEMVRIIKRNVTAFGWPEPTPIACLGGTDARLWRHRNIPAFIYGCHAHGMASSNEFVDEEELFHVVRTHVLSAYDYLCELRGEY